jgi:hypothetical protein
MIDSFVSSVQGGFRGSSLLATLPLLLLLCPLPLPPACCMPPCMHMSCDLSAGVCGSGGRRSRTEKKIKIKWQGLEEGLVV